MSELCHFYGIRIYVYFNDHAPPHIHAIYGEYQAQIAIDDGCVLSGSLPHRARRMVKKWLEQRREEVAEAWHKASVREDPGKIDPLT